MTKAIRDAATDREEDNRTLREEFLEAIRTLSHNAADNGEQTPPHDSAVPNAEEAASTPAGPTSMATEFPSRANNSIKEFTRGNALSKFSGTNAKSDAANWIELFEFMSQGLTAGNRVRSLVPYLTEDAVEWFVSEIARPDINDWDEVKRKFLARYGSVTVPYAVAAEQRRMNRKDTVSEYAKDKMRLLKLAGINESSALALLTNGTPPNYQTALFAQNPKTFDDWLRIAVSLENSLNRYRNTYKTKDEVNATEPKKNFSPNSKAPKCRICARKGLTKFHWHRECPEKRSSPPNTDARPAESNPIDGVDVPETVNYIQPSFVYLDIRINGSKTRAFLDTGSSISIIPRKTAHRLGLKIDFSRTILVTHVSGNTRSYGTINAELEIGLRTHLVEFHVFERSDTHALIGAKEAKLFGLTANLANGKLTQKLDGFRVRCERDQ